MSVPGAARSLFALLVCIAGSAPSWAGAPPRSATTDARFPPCPRTGECPVIVARVALTPGQAIERADVAQIWLTGPVDPAETAGVAHQLSQVLGRRVRDRIFPGEPIRAERLEQPPKSGDPADRWVVPGMRLAWVPHDPAVAPFAPGANLDVLWRPAEGPPCRVLQVVPVIGVQDARGAVRTDHRVIPQTGSVVLLDPAQTIHLEWLRSSPNVRFELRDPTDIHFREDEVCPVGTLGREID